MTCAASWAARWLFLETVGTRLALLRRPGFAADMEPPAQTLALGIGAGTAIFKGPRTGVLESASFHIGMK